MKILFENTTQSAKPSEAQLNISASTQVSVKDLFRETDVCFTTGDYQRALNCCVTCMAAEGAHPVSEHSSQKAIKSKLTYFLKKAFSSVEVGGNDKQGQNFGRWWRRGT